LGAMNQAKRPTRRVGARRVDLLETEETVACPRKLRPRLMTHVA